MRGWRGVGPWKGLDFRQQPFGLLSCLVQFRSLRSSGGIIAVVSDPRDNRSEGEPSSKPGSPWRYIIMWTTFGVTLVVTVVVVVQAILKTTGFD